MGEAVYCDFFFPTEKALGNSLLIGSLENKEVPTDFCKSIMCLRV